MNQESKNHNSKFMLHNSARRAFTLIETILVIAFLAILFSLSAPLYQTLQVRTDLLVAVDVFTQTASRAQTLASYMHQDSGWGVKVTVSGGKVDDIILFKGVSFTGRDTAYDEVFDAAPSLEVSGDSEIAFTKFTGELVAASSTTTISAPQINLSRVVAINKKGKIDVTEP